MPTVLYNIGNTPLVRINKINKSEGVECEMRKYHEYADNLETRSIILTTICALKIVSNNLIF